MKPSNRNFTILYWLLGSISACALVITGLNLLTTPTSSPEWVYTVEQINRFALPALVAAGLLTGGYFTFLLSRRKYTRLIMFLCCCILITIPLLFPYYYYLHWQMQYLLSICWGLGLSGFGFLLFLLGARSTPVLAFLWCAAGSLILAFGAMEILLLCSSQPADGKSNLSSESKYAIGEGSPEYALWTPSQCGRTSAPLGAPHIAWHSELKFNEKLYDVHYFLDDNAHRRLPVAPDAQNDLILFGCSFTFGHGLEEEQTWAWKLAKLLGPKWQLVNYGGNGYSPNHMLCLLEHNLVAPLTGKHRYALFFAIEDHLTRNEFFPFTPHYYLNANNEAEHGGNQKLTWVYNLPRIFNGSQLAREISGGIRSFALKNLDDKQRLFLAILSKSAHILKEKYETQLIVLLWPDLDFMQEDIKSLGIPVINSRRFLNDWGEYGAPYCIHPKYEGHPNAYATDKIAQALKLYFDNLIHPSTAFNSQLDFH